MNQPLDLCIALTPPPDGASSGILASVTLNCELLGLSHAGELLADPLTPQEREDLRWYLEEYPKWPFEGFLERGRWVEQRLPVIGRRLYRAVFGSSGARQIMQAWQKHPGQGRQINIISDLPRVLSLPWELLHTRAGFLTLRTRQPVSIVRRLPESISQQHKLSFAPPLRILLVPARPKGTGFVDPRGIARELVDELQEQVEAGAITLEFLRPATFEGLRMRLRDRKHPIHILHFDGHGMFDNQAGGQGQLAFEDERGYRDLVDARMLASLLQASGVPLVVLTACQSGMGAEEDAFSSVAAQLIHQGVDAVVAMSTSVLVASASRYTETFYRALARGTTVPLAHVKAKQGLQRDPGRHLLHRRLEEEGHLVQLRDWWLPHFYQQHALTFQLPPSAKPHKTQSKEVKSLQRLNKDMPAAPRYGFTGRSQELLQMERWLSQGKLVIITGFSGGGKTALAREAADWLTRTGMYSRACFISFEHGGDTSTLLSTLGRFLGVYDDYYNPQDHAMALARLVSTLKQYPTLVIADNLESLLPKGESPLPLEERLALWETLRELSKLKAGVLLTSRDPQVGDGQLGQGKAVGHLALGGLHLEDAILLASRLLDQLKIDRICAPYRELCDLLEQLDYHPLAIQLVLPTLRTRSLDIIRQQFANLLDQFTVSATIRSNSSLLASLQHSINSLSDEQQVLLPRLALFEGGAGENELLSITEIPSDTWKELRSVLEQSALVTAENVHKNIINPFLHFHPVLVPFLRRKVDSTHPILRSRYTKHYLALADYFFVEDFHAPDEVGAMIKFELPNFKHALALLIEGKKFEDAYALADKLRTFMRRFGYTRELDQLRQQMEKFFSTSGSKIGKKFTRAIFFREIHLADDALLVGEVQSALNRLDALLKRITSLPTDRPLGSGSFEHSVVLSKMSQCFAQGGQPAIAEVDLRQALAIVEDLLKKEPKNTLLVHQRMALLNHLGTTLYDRGRYPEAQAIFEEHLKFAQEQGDFKNQAILFQSLGRLELRKKNYVQAREYYKAALEFSGYLNLPEHNAVFWHQLGIIAQEQEQLDEAERCYRECLKIREWLGNLSNIAQTCTQLGNLALKRNRFPEARAWYKRSLSLYEEEEPNSPSHALILNNLANLKMVEVKNVLISKDSLNEARQYAEQALKIRKPLGLSSEIWTTYFILAEIAQMEGNQEISLDYLLLECETYAAFTGNRAIIDRYYLGRITDFAEAIRNQMARQIAEFIHLPKLEADGWHITEPIHRLWAGERKWDRLVEGLHGPEALFILRILETLSADPFQRFTNAIVVAARGHRPALGAVLEMLPKLEAKGFHISTAVQHVLKGERDLNALSKGLDQEGKQLIKDVLDTLAWLD